ncbi:hypothetical protein SAMN06269250_1592 [Spirosoma fluviale]|uniref:Uncharacterized protein n=2 Tax=Spirosoma fluviale TaxID=1597977 RepID=A0A286FDG1_9BACT|nr:hypothetical protein SAMN06269250_1592 [Spirosoma fluviale]
MSLSFSPLITKQIMSTLEIKSQEAKLQNLEALQARMKATNTTYKKWIKAGKDSRALIQAGLDSDQIRKIETYKEDYNKQPHPSWEITNNGATIRNTKKRIEELTKRVAEAQAADGEDKEIDFDGGKVIYNYTDERLQVDFNQKPEPKMIRLLKENGFKWAPSVGLWQRQLTDNAKHVADWLFKIGSYAPQAVAEREATQKAQLEAQLAQWAIPEEA